MNYYFLKPEEFNRLDIYANCLQFALSVIDNDFPISLFAKLKKTGNIETDFIQFAQKFGLKVKSIPKDEELSYDKIYFIVWGWYPRFIPNPEKEDDVKEIYDDFHVVRVEKGRFFHKSGWQCQAAEVSLSRLQRDYPEDKKKFVFELLD